MAPLVGHRGPSLPAVPGRPFPRAALPPTFVLTPGRPVLTPDGCSSPSPAVAAPPSSPTEERAFRLRSTTFRGSLLPPTPTLTARDSVSIFPVRSSERQREARERQVGRRVPRKRAGAAPVGDSLPLAAAVAQSPRRAGGAGVRGGGGGDAVRRSRGRWA